MKVGKMLLLGSGETSHSGGKSFEAALQDFEDPIRIRILETPAGFELNSSKVAGRVADYMKIRLQNLKPEIRLIPARQRQGENGTNSEELSLQTAEGDFIFLGPGSPTYTVRQLKNSLLFDIIQLVFLQGGILALASAATIAFGKYSLPVYEIYKVGEDPYWNEGLNFLSLLGMDVSFIPHWNNADGGAELDTTHCFIGKERFDALKTKLPVHHPIIGLDEQTSLLIDFSEMTGKVIGQGEIHILKDGKELHFSKNDHFSLSFLGSVQIPTADKFDHELLEKVAKVRKDMKNKTPIGIPDPITKLVEERESARKNRLWAEADNIRRQLEIAGWRVVDSPEGPIIEQIS